MRRFSLFMAIVVAVWTVGSDASGAIVRGREIADVPPGEYVLQVWQENLPEIILPLSVGETPIELEIP